MVAAAAAGAAAAYASSSPALNMMVHYVAPIVGSVLGFILSVTPIHAVHLAEKAGQLGDLNPLPSCVFLANCCIWLLYGAATGDHFVFCANVPAVPVSLHLILHMYPLASKRIRRQMEGMILATSLLLLFLGMMYVFDSSKLSTVTQINGDMAMVVQILLYASPLSALLHVVRTRNAASILLPWTLAALGCSSTWFVYGVATKQLPVTVPHSLGLLLALVQLSLRAVFPTRDSDGDSESESESDEEGGEKESAMGGGRRSATLHAVGSLSPAGRRGRNSWGGRSRALSMTAACGDYLEWEKGVAKGKGRVKGGLGGGDDASCCLHPSAADSLSRHRHQHHQHHQHDDDDDIESGAGGRKRGGRFGSASRRAMGTGGGVGGVELVKRMLQMPRTGSRVGMLQMEDRAGDDSSEEEEGGVDLEARSPLRRTRRPNEGADDKGEDRPPAV